MEDTLRSETRIRAFPRHAVMDRKMLKAAINARVLHGGASGAWFSLLVKFPIPVIFAIVVGCSETLSLRCHEEPC